MCSTVEHVAALLAHRVAEDTAEQPDIFAQPRIRFARHSFGRATGPIIGVGKSGLGRRCLRRHILGIHG